MHPRLRLFVALLGAFFTLQGVGWIIAPAATADSLGMPLLDGLGRSTQVGDFASFFVVSGLTMVIGSRPGRARMLLFPAALLGGAAVMRTLAWLLHGADFAGLFIAVEVVTASILLRAASAPDTTA